MTLRNAIPRESKIPANSIGSTVLAGFIGGPLAIAYIFKENSAALNFCINTRRNIALLLVALSIWLFGAICVPPDAISQLLFLLPQTVLWWLVIRQLMQKSVIAHQSNGGEFKSKWHAAKVGLVFKIASMALFFIIANFSSH
jgi:hypothetical protein